MKNNLNNKLIYQVFVRNYSIDGTFNAVSKDIKHIKEMGFDYLYLLPIHPIGKLDRKGKWGSPYSIIDYKEISPDLGSLEDFKNLIKIAHEHGLKVIMDIVFHHTSRDAIYIKDHPEWYVYNKEGQLANKVGDWSDIADFEFDQKDDSLEDYLISVLQYWTNLGVDGYRCDVASLVPLSFWIKAKKAICEINKDSILIGESVEPEFLEFVLSKGYNGVSDKDLYLAFDALYDYDVFPYFKKALVSNDNLAAYVKALNEQRILLGDFMKMRFLENHDQKRIASLLDKHRLIKWIDFISMMNGPLLIYAGQENGNKHLPDLFEKDVVDATFVDIEIVNAYKLAFTKKKAMDELGVFVVNIEVKENIVKFFLNKEFKGKTTYVVDFN